MTTASETPLGHPEDSPHGLWRDEDLLVIARQSNRFEARCIKTNSTNDVSWHEISSDPGSALVSGFAITMGMLHSPRGLAKVVRNLETAKQRQVFLAIPLSAQWYSEWNRTSRKGRLLIFGGIGCFIGSTVAYMGCMAAGVPESIAGILLIPFALAIPVAIAGLIYMMASHKPIFTVKKATPDHLWIRGASMEFLASLPSWTGDINS
jgi:hypothetical protein